jgi:hypothetical protein
MSSSSKSGGGDERRGGRGDEGEVPSFDGWRGLRASLFDLLDAELRRRWDEIGIALAL